MDKDRVAGSAKKIKGSIKEVVGKTAGNAKLEAEGKADKVEGKVQNAVGGLKDKGNQPAKNVAENISECKLPFAYKHLPVGPPREGAATVVMSPRRILISDI